MEGYETNIVLSPSCQSIPGSHKTDLNYADCGRFEVESGPSLLLTNTCKICTYMSFPKFSAGMVEHSVVLSKRYAPKMPALSRCAIVLANFGGGGKLLT